MAEQKQVKYDVDGYETVTSALMELLNQYPDLATATSFRFYERAYKNLEDKVLELLERVA